MLSCGISDCAERICMESSYLILHRIFNETFDLAERVCMKEISPDP